MSHKHRAIALHSPEQQAKFFALSDELKYNKEDVKDRAKKHFNVSCFNDLKKGDMMWLIDRLQQQYDKRQTGTQ